MDHKDYLHCDSFGFSPLLSESLLDFFLHCNLVICLLYDFLPWCVNIWHDFFCVLIMKNGLQQKSKGSWNRLDFIYAQYNFLFFLFLVWNKTWMCIWCCEILLMILCFLVSVTQENDIESKVLGVKQENNFFNYSTPTLPLNTWPQRNEKKALLGAYPYMKLTSLVG